MQVQLGAPIVDTPLLPAPAHTRSLTKGLRPTRPTHMALRDLRRQVRRRRQTRSRQLTASKLAAGSKSADELLNARGLRKDGQTAHEWLRHARHKHNGSPMRSRFCCKKPTRPRERRRAPTTSTCRTMRRCSSSGATALALERRGPLSRGGHPVEPARGPRLATGAPRPSDWSTRFITLSTRMNDQTVLLANVYAPSDLSLLPRFGAS